MENFTTKKTEDYVIVTGKQYSIKKFVNIVCQKLRFKIIWRGKVE